MSDEFEDEAPTKQFERTTLPSTYWLTRDRKHGELSATVEVWAVKPDRIRMYDGDVMWMAPPELVDLVETHVDDWSIAQCLKQCYVYPDDDRMCIRVGEEPVRLSAVVAS